MIYTYFPIETKFPAALVAEISPTRRTVKSAPLRGTAAIVINFLLSNYVIVPIGARLFPDNRYVRWTRFCSSVNRRQVLGSTYTVFYLFLFFRYTFLNNTYLGT